MASCLGVSFSSLFSFNRSSCCWITITFPEPVCFWKCKESQELFKCSLQLQRPKVSNNINNGIDTYLKTPAYSGSWLRRSKRSFCTNCSCAKALRINASLKRRLQRHPRDMVQNSGSEHPKNIKKPKQLATWGWQSSLITATTGLRTNADRPGEGDQEDAKPRPWQKQPAEVAQNLTFLVSVNWSLVVFAGFVLGF